MASKEIKIVMTSTFDDETGKEVIRPGDILVAVNGFPAGSIRVVAQNTTANSLQLELELPNSDFESGWVEVIKSNSKRLSGLTYLIEKTGELSMVDNKIAFYESGAYHSIAPSIAVEGDIPLS